MITDQENAFVEYWEANRLRKKKVFRQLYLGLPLASLLIIAIFVNFISGWYKWADMALHREGSSLILVLMVAAILIVVFVVVFSVRHKWDQNEQHYQELLHRKNKKS